MLLSPSKRSFPSCSPVLTSSRVFVWCHRNSREPSLLFLSLQLAPCPPLSQLKFCRQAFSCYRNFSAHVICVLLFISHSFSTELLLEELWRAHRAVKQRCRDRADRPPINRLKPWYHILIIELCFTILNPAHNKNILKACNYTCLFFFTCWRLCVSCYLPRPSTFVFAGFLHFPCKQDKQRAAVTDC